jgi:hypothetical protein
MEITIKRQTKNFQEQMQDLLSKKDKLVKQDAGDGRNKYQVAVDNLKKKIKEYNKDLKNNEPKVKFNSLLQGVKKQERAGTFDRGAEGKAKNKLRKRMAGKPKEVFTRGRHTGSKYDDLIPSRLDSEQNVDLSKGLAGETEAQRKKRKNKMTTAKMGKSR